MVIQQNVSLQAYNTFGISILAEQYIAINTYDELLEALAYIQSENIPYFILNGGSNILFTRNVEGVVLHLKIKGIQKIEESESNVVIEGAASENWNNFVQYCIAQNWGGLENLSLIPGNVGTSPMQNIGAYGVEIKDHFHSLTALNLATLEFKTFQKEECQFGYRESYFKGKGKNQFIITAVRFSLQKPPHTLHSQYGALQSELEKRNIKNPSIQDMAEAVIRIRETKLPNPKVLGNAGSFFKNPIITKASFEPLLHQYPDIPHYIQDENKVKIPAGWLIETAGWKGKRIGHCGVYEKQALILVNYGGATGEEIYSLSQLIMDDVQKKFDIVLEREVNIY